MANKHVVVKRRAENINEALDVMINQQKWFIGVLTVFLGLGAVLGWMKFNDNFQRYQEFERRFEKELETELDELRGEQSVNGMVARAINRQYIWASFSYENGEKTVKLKMTYEYVIESLGPGIAQLFGSEIRMSPQIINKLSKYIERRSGPDVARKALEQDLSVESFYRDSVRELLPKYGARSSMTTTLSLNECGEAAALLQELLELEPGTGDGGAWIDVTPLVSNLSAESPQNVAHRIPVKYVDNLKLNCDS